MNEHKPFQEFIQELRRAEIELTDDTSSQNQSLLDFEYDIPLLFNGHILLPRLYICLAAMNTGPIRSDGTLRLSLVDWLLEFQALP